MKGAQRLGRAILLLAAAMLMVMGTMLLVTPIPLGIPMLTVGLVLAVATSRTAARLVRDWRSRLLPLDWLIGVLETNAGARLRRVLEETRPDRSPIFSPTARAFGT